MPLTTLNSEVLPAPLGPIRPWMTLACMVNDTSESAWTPPNERVTLLTESMLTSRAGI
ncbi:Uncharacterised protein [Bordetella pertussis]|nr:Uncharacterised protein [Bordetella pertussis]